MDGTRRVGIVGAGFIGAVHARSSRLSGARVVGVATSTPERAQQAAARIGAERAFPSAEALIDSPELDVVHICAPNHLHAPLALRALEGGKDVICEKPLATSVAQAEEQSTALVRAGGTLVTIAEPPTIQPENGRAVFFVVEPDRSQLAGLAQRLRAGRLTVDVAAVRPLAEAPAAFSPNAARVSGKTIIQVAEGW